MRLYGKMLTGFSGINILPITQIILYDHCKGRKMANRDSQQVRQDLLSLVQDDLRKRNIMIEALRSGYFSGKLSLSVDARLCYDDNLEDLVNQLTEFWDGENFIAGAMAAANQYMRKQK
jgi:hypothetical protein